MIDIGIYGIDALNISGYHRRAFSTAWMSPNYYYLENTNIPGKRFICVLYMNKTDLHDYLLEIQVCDLKCRFDLNTPTMREHVKLIDRETLEKIFNPSKNGFDLVEIQGRAMFKFRNDLLINKRPTEYAIYYSKVGDYLYRNGVNIALMLCYQDKICSLDDAEKVKMHMNRVYEYYSELSEYGNIDDGIKRQKKIIDDNKQKILDLASKRNSILSKKANGIETLKKYGLQYFEENRTIE